MVNDRLYRNIKGLLRRDDIKIGDLERQIEVSAGYISRRKGLSADKLVRISEVLGCSIDDLLTKDMYVEAEKDRIIREIRKNFEKMNIPDAMMVPMMDSIHSVLDRYFREEVESK